MRKVFSIVMVMLSLVMRGQTLEECQQAAADNYPQIKRYALISRQTEESVRNIGKSWLPQLSAMAQATWQSDVVTLPEAMGNMLTQAGVDMKGLRKDQYRVGLDLSQTLFDGGSISQQQEVSRRQGEVEAARTAVDIYQVRQRVNDLYFLLLLTKEQRELSQDRLTLLLASERQLQSLYSKGAAAECDYNTVKAERITAQQQEEELAGLFHDTSLQLSTLCGMEVKNPVIPSTPSTVNGMSNNRPELSLIDQQISLLNAQEKALNGALMPKLSLFASGYYGYPGYDMYHDMFSHDWTWNGMIGARVTWNIGALYTRKGDKAKLEAQRAMAEVQRETFLFNNRLQTIQQNGAIERYRQQMNHDDDIVDLRARVRKASESKLAHGIIDAPTLVRDINNEHAAKIQRNIHIIEWLKQQYDLLITLNIER